MQDRSARTPTHQHTNTTHTTAQPHQRITTPQQQQRDQSMQSTVLFVEECGHAWMANRGWHGKQVEATLPRSGATTPVFQGVLRARAHRSPRVHARTNARKHTTPCPSSPPTYARRQGQPGTHARMKWHLPVRPRFARPAFFTLHNGCAEASKLGLGIVIYIGVWNIPKHLGILPASSTLPGGSGFAALPAGLRCVALVPMQLQRM